MLRRPAAWMAIAAVFLPLVLGSCAPFERPPAWSEVFGEYLGETRWFEGRTTLELGWAPFDNARDLPFNDRQMLHGAIILRGRQDASGLDRALGLYFLWRNEAGDVDRARAEVERLPPGAVALNERALVELTRGDPLAALEAVEEALELRPRMPEALFNRALVLQRLHLFAEARASWQRYLEVDGDSPWADEARRHQQALVEPRDELEEVRDFLWSAVGSISTRAALDAFLLDPVRMEQLRHLARQGEPGLLNQVRWLKGLTTEGWRREQAALRLSREIYDSMMKGAAVDRTQLRAWMFGPSPRHAVTAGAWLRWEAFQRGDFAEAERLAESMLEICSLHGFPEFCALAQSDLATARMARGDFQGALRAFSDAAELLPDGSSSRRGELLVKEADLVAEMGAWSEAERLARRSLPLLAHLPAAQAIAYRGLAEYVHELGFHRAALVHAEAALPATSSSGRLQQLRTAVSVARFNLELGRKEQALRILDEEIARGGSQYGMAGLLSLKAEVLVEQGAREEALRLFDSVFAAIPNDAWFSFRDVLRLRAESLSEAGEEARALEDLERAYALEQARRDDPLGPLPLVRLRAKRAALVAPLAELLVRAGRGEDAWRLVTSGEGRLAPGLCGIAFLGRGKKTLVLAKVGDSVMLDTVETEAEDAGLEEILDRVGSPFGERRCPADTERLLVIENPFTRIGVGGRLSRRHRPEIPVAIARTAWRSWPSTRAAGPALAIHTPTLDLRDYWVPPLPHAREEARLILSRIPGSQELQRDEATPEAVSRRAGDFGILHFAVHGESRSGKGAASHLRLAGERGHLQVKDILQLDLSGRPLVVLSACRGGGWVADREQDGAGLAWAFLEAGAGAVIATEDSIEDAAALEFSRVLYDELHRGADVSSAFERAVSSLRGRWTNEVASGFNLYL